LLRLSDDRFIRFEHVIKDFQMEGILSSGIKNVLLNLPRHFKQVAKPRMFRALDDVSFELYRGDCLGVIGRNGSGKVLTSGHICPLLELGAGFHSDLTGRENIFLNGILLGMTRKQVRAKFYEIVEFSELQEFLDRPLRTYSSGMVARLGFSVAVHLDPEILLVDEILAVGDIAFAAKCMQKMEEFRKRGVMIVFVSHSPGAVATLCDKALWLEHGKMVMIGDAPSVCKKYQQGMVTPEQAAKIESTRKTAIVPTAARREHVPDELNGAATFGVTGGSSNAQH
jgi:lipopolysaccharide transport system ATP-binding protein